MNTKDLIYCDGGVECCGFLASDESLAGLHPGIVVAHEAWGLGEHAMDRARMLADLGYTVLAADLYGSRRYVHTLEEATALTRSLRAQPGRLRSRIRTAMSALAAQPHVDPRRLGAIGFCFGGTAVLELARSGADLRGVVSFHGGMLPVVPAEPGAVRASILVCAGADDPTNPPEHIAAFVTEMRAAKADYQLILYGNTQHSFTNPHADSSLMPGLAYNRRSDRRSWLAMQRFFDEVFLNKGEI